ncbi:MAG TPA: hypothetical protein VKQ72_02460 [Aggregatilineales bacterium]|nr:hypothetical protein [Aggregatilineales bacterium]
MPTLALELPAVDVEAKFHRLADAWREETAHLSSMTEIILNPNYQRIIGMGPQVLPILLRELRDNPDHWFWALEAITGTNPTNPEDAGNLQKMRQSWLNFARKAGYVV